VPSRGLVLMLFVLRVGKYVLCLLWTRLLERLID